MTLDIRKITVFTPTYNRKDKLTTLYESLLNQTYQEFEWLIIDDGSSDNTKELIDDFIKDQKIEINYHYKENQGKCMATNLAAKKARGVLFFTVDSDDFLPEDALEIIIEEYQKIKDQADVAGLFNLMKIKRGGENKVDMPPFDIGYYNTIDMRFRNEHFVDMPIVLKTSILQKYPYPFISGEKYSRPSLIFHRMSKKYKFFYTGRVIYCAEYLEGGLTDNFNKLVKENRNYNLLYMCELTKMNIPTKTKHNFYNDIIGIFAETRDFRLILKYFFKMPMIDFLLFYFSRKFCKS